MPASAARVRVSGPAARLSIGQVLARLNPEFPDLSPSKLRFLEEQGLITPARTESGYRKFCSADVDRLQLILSMQRDQYLPLKVIRTYLAELDEGREPALPGSATPGPSMLSAVRRFSREELLRQSGATAALLDDAIAASLVSPSEVYTDDTVSVITALVELKSSGIEPRHLRGFRGAAERELGLIESALAPLTRRKTSSSRAQAAERAHEIAAQLEVVRASLIRSALNRLSS